MDRRKFLVTSTAAAAALNLPTLAKASGGIDIFGLKSVSGNFASYGKFANQGSEMAVEAAGSVIGKDLNYRLLDSEGNAGKAVRKIKEAIEKDDARFFNGATLSSTGLAVGKEVASVGGVFTTPVGADEVTGSECNRSTFRWSTPTFGAVEQTLRPLLELDPSIKSAYTVTPQYVFGEALLTNTKNVLADKGVEHVGNSYHSLSEKEFSGYITNAAAAKPDLLILLNFGGQSSTSLRQAMNFGLKNKMKILVVWSAGLDQYKSLGSDILEDVYLGAQYWHEVQNPGNARFVELCRSKYGVNPVYPMAGDYIGTKIIIDAIEKAGSDDPAAVISAMEGMTYEGLTGEETIRAFDHQAIKDYYLLKGKSKSAMSDEDNFVDVISSGKSFPDENASLCKMS
ncbi:amino acid/amide ABC transporter substrate-binding protein, HAAT family [Ruegeria halocynthiae]|uniref:Amino acid/amide ABC transporter substrate-binding protein, HAAT family n=1 Tax=Ruegeria halocynthiae TaxID=985054 RepID=A0A1H3FWV2_9RHOB|nr:ABC transporter substrate-binding protein [Ruegeria halocynthiae]SDX95390.1 amino acid/amide ABC transporter substrate-binding protein, HAAT family [Ruegeria halocynthiae]